MIMNILRTGRTITRGTLVVAGVGLIAAACSSAPTAAQFDSNANSICQTYNAKLKSVSSELVLPGSTTDKHREAEISSALTAAQPGSSKLQSLARPTGNESALQKAFKAQDAQINDLKGLLAALKQNQVSRVESFETAFEESEAPLNQQFDVLGLSTCGSGSPALSK
jgi:hypothetical protein